VNVGLSSDYDGHGRRALRRLLVLHGRKTIWRHVVVAPLGFVLENETRFIIFFCSLRRRRGRRRRGRGLAVRNVTAVDTFFALLSVVHLSDHALHARHLAIHLAPTHGRSSMDCR